MRVPPAGWYRIGARLPSAPQFEDSRPMSCSHDSMIIAPAPSPNSTQVVRSVQSTTLLITSQPTTAIFLGAGPARSMHAATSSAYKNPLQPAETSNAGMPRICSSF
jgi:hypothetical protein